MTDKPTCWATWEWSLVAAVEFNLTPGDARTLNVLAMHANVEGRCWPSLARIEYLAGYKAHPDRANVRRSLARLEALGLIAVARRPGVVNQYRVALGARPQPRAAERGVTIPNPAPGGAHPAPGSAGYPAPGSAAQQPREEPLKREHAAVTAQTVLPLPMLAPEPTDTPALNVVHGRRRPRRADVVNAQPRQGVIGR